MKRAVIYYSLSGNTKTIAQTVADKLGADLFEIGTVKPMPDGFWQQMMYGGMQAVFGLKPEITGMPENLREYKEIIIGTPVWADKHAPAINTFIHTCRVRKRVKGVFTLSGSGNNEKCVAGLMKLLPNLEYTVSLLDAKKDQPEENAARLDAFVEKLIG